MEFPLQVGEEIRFNARFASSPEMLAAAQQLKEKDNTHLSYQAARTWAERAGKRVPQPGQTDVSWLDLLAKMSLELRHRLGNGTKFLTASHLSTPDSLYTGDLAEFVLVLAQKKEPARKPFVYAKFDATVTCHGRTVTVLRLRGCTVMVPKYLNT